MANPILLVEHASGDLAVLAEALARQGYARRRIAESADPLPVFTEIEAELVFISLGRADAQQVCEALRLDPDGAIVPVIFVGSGGSGSGQESVRSPADALASGGDFYFEQPLDVGAVLAKVKTYVGAPSVSAAADQKKPTIPANPQAPNPPRPPAATRHVASATRLPSFAWQAQPSGASRPTSSIAGASDALLAQIQTREATRGAAPLLKQPVAPGDARPEVQRALPTPRARPTSAPAAVAPQQASATPTPRPQPVGRYTRAPGRRVKRLCRRPKERRKATPAPQTTRPLQLQQPDPGRALDSLIKHVDAYQSPAAAGRAGLADRPDTNSPAARQLVALRPPRGALGAHAEVAAVLCEAAQQEVTGCIVFNNEAGAKSIYFTRGAPTAATSNMSEDRFEAYLRREGRITRGQMQAAREHRNQSIRQQAAAWVAQGYLKTEEAAGAVRGHLEEIIYGLFEWQSGNYTYQPELPPDDACIALDVTPQALIIEGIRRKYVMNRLLQHIGGADSIVKPVTDRKIEDHFGLTPAERSVARQIDGRRTVEDLILGTDLCAERVYQVLMGLISVGCAHVDAADATGETRITSQASEAIDRRRILEKSVAAQQLDYFQILGVAPQSTAYEVERAYERNMDEFATQRFTRTIQASLAGELRDIQEVLRDARDVLINDVIRHRYGQRASSPPPADGSQA